MSIDSVNLLKERVLRAAFEYVAEFEEREGVSYTKGSRALVRAVKALREETWRLDEAPIIIRELLALVEQTSGAVETKARAGAVLRAKTFLGERNVEDDTTPTPRPRKEILRRSER